MSRDSVSTVAFSSLKSRPNRSKLDFLASLTQPNYLYKIIPFPAKLIAYRAKSKPLKSVSTQTISRLIQNSSNA